MQFFQSNDAAFSLLSNLIGKPLNCTFIFVYIFFSKYWKQYFSSDLSFNVWKWKKKRNTWLISTGFGEFFVENKNGIRFEGKEYNMMLLLNKYNEITVNSRRKCANIFAKIKSINWRVNSLRF